jgi:hypothetical protein
MKRRTILQAAACASVLAVGPVPAQVTDLNDAINKAGRQRMLSQRIGKAYLAIVGSVEAGLARQVLDRSMALFDRQLVELKAYASQPDLRDTYTALEAAWSEYKLSLIGTAPSKAGAPVVMGHAAKVLALAHKGTQQYEALLNKPVGKLVNVAGRQRMLSQRMAKFYFASALQADGGSAREEIGKARTEFLTALQLLKGAPEATARIRDELQLGEAQWLLFDNALQKPAAGAAAKPLSDVFVTSENLLVVMDKVTSMYTELKA